MSKTILLSAIRAVVCAALPTIALDRSRQWPAEVN
jgi:hypothetical protein